MTVLSDSSIDSWIVFDRADPKRDPVAAASRYRRLSYRDAEGAPRSVLRKVLFHLRGYLVGALYVSPRATWKAPAHVGLYPSACYVGNLPMFRRRMYLNMRPVLLVRPAHVHTSALAYAYARAHAHARGPLCSAELRGELRGCLNIAATLYDRTQNLLPVRVGGFPVRSPSVKAADRSRPSARRTVLRWCARGDTARHAPAVKRAAVTLLV